ncbi:hypothetical protein [Arthrobacter sp. MYb227]|uniref:hypothetical protein n=1 Tax=Arthrobacter sp. MYb227 TaxID=1848601 RepID=UPI001C611E35|nr:hypothetical protein [Arthrobacter sp. MYb227]
MSVILMEATSDYSKPFSSLWRKSRYLSSSSTPNGHETSLAGKPTRERRNLAG